MTKAQAITQVMNEAERRNEVLSSFEIASYAIALIESSKVLRNKMNEYNSLSDRRMNTQAQGKESVYSVIRTMNVSTASEFLGEEFWMSLNSVSERVVVNRVYNSLRARLTKGM